MNLQDLRIPGFRTVHTRPALAPVTFLLLALAACGGGPPADLILTDARVVDVEAGEVLPPATVSIRDGRIAAVTPSDEPPSDARTILDAEGGYLIPGLWDMHVHFRGGEELIPDNRALLPLYIANGITTVRDGGGDITPAVLGWRERIARGDLTGPRILTSGPKLDGPTGGWEGSIRLTEPDQVPQAIDSLEALGVDYVKIYDGTIPGDVYLEILAETERRGLRATGHMPFSVDFREAVAAGLDATEHLYYAFKGGAANEDSVTAEIVAREGTDDPLGFWRALELLRPAWDDERARETFERMAAAGTAAVPTLHIGRVLSWVDEVDHDDDPELRYISPEIQETWAGRVTSARRASPEARAERRALQERFIAMIQPMHEAGVRLLAGSDAGPFNSYVYPGFSLHAELEELVGAGLTNAEALRAATADAADFMGRGGELGRIEEGFRADLVLLGSNPLEAITNTRDIRAVIVDGRAPLERDALDALLEQAASTGGG